MAMPGPQKTASEILATARAKRSLGQQPTTHYGKQAKAVYSQPTFLEEGILKGILNLLFISCLLHSRPRPQPTSANTTPIARAPVL